MRVQQFSMLASCALKRCCRLLVLLVIAALPVVLATDEQTLARQDAIASKQGVMRVTTAAQFDAAMQVGVQYIQIEAHLDLRDLTPLPGGTPKTLYQLDSKIQVIQVCAARCLPADMQTECHSCTINCMSIGAASRTPDGVMHNSSDVDHAKAPIQMLFQLAGKVHLASTPWLATQEPQPNAVCALACCWFVGHTS